MIMFLAESLQIVLTCHKFLKFVLFIRREDKVLIWDKLHQYNHQMTTLFIPSNSSLNTYKHNTDVDFIN